MFTNKFVSNNTHGKISKFSRNMRHRRYLDLSNGKYPGPTAQVFQGSIARSPIQLFVPQTGNLKTLRESSCKENLQDFLKSYFSNLFHQNTLNLTCVAQSEAKKSKQRRSRARSRDVKLVQFIKVFSTNNSSEINVSVGTVNLYHV